MRRFIPFLTALLLWPSLALAQVPLTGAGLGAPTVSATYQGPGDVSGGYTFPFAWFSCSRAYNNAWAAGTGNLCLLYGPTTTTTCTLKAAANGFADLTSALCVGGTVSVTTFCTVTNSSCYVETAYDQSGNGRDVTQATSTSMPRLILSSSPTGTLPVINCGGGTYILQQAITTSLSQPMTYSAVVEVTTGGSEGGIIGASSGGNSMLGQGSAANKLAIYSSTELDSSATDSVWHSVQALGSNTSSVVKVDAASDTTGSAGSTGWSGLNLRLCRAFATQFTGYIAEAGIWAATSSSTNRTNIEGNQHGTSGYNF